MLITSHGAAQLALFDCVAKEPDSLYKAVCSRQQLVQVYFRRWEPADLKNKGSAVGVAVAGSLLQGQHLKLR